MLAWIYKSLAAGLCDALVHTGLMFVKSALGLLPSFGPYAALRAALASWPAAAAHPALAWAVSVVSGAAVLGLLFGRLYTHLPGPTGIAKGESSVFWPGCTRGLCFSRPWARAVRLGCRPWQRGRAALARHVGDLWRRNGTAYASACTPARG
jgi:hypothetical protein